ncbi:hypothetical protein NC651_002684 [Populus alba x Populus x berolinensis]|nr:hypothetical protein NC651_002684 [Populus alba x Populus x berolinensis]
MNLELFGYVNKFPFCRQDKTYGSALLFSHVFSGTKLTGALHEDYCGRATFKYRVRILSFASAAAAAAMYAYGSVAVLVLRTGATARLPIELYITYGLWLTSS